MVIDRLIKYIDNLKWEKMTAYDLGSGNGKDAQVMRRNGWEVTELDLPNVDLNKPYDNGGYSVELVYSGFCLQFIKEKEIFIRTCYNLLKDNGFLFIQTFDASDKNSGSFNMKESKLQELLSEGGFTNIHIDKFSVIDTEHDKPHEHIVLEATARKGG